MDDSYDLTPEMQAKIREHATGQWLVALTRIVLNLYDDPNQAKTDFGKIVDDLVDGYNFYDQPKEVGDASRDLMRKHLDDIMCQLMDR